MAGCSSGGDHRAGQQHALSKDKPRRNTSILVRQPVNKLTVFGKHGEEVAVRGATGDLRNQAAAMGGKRAVWRESHAGHVDGFCPDGQRDERRVYKPN